MFDNSYSEYRRVLDRLIKTGRLSTFAAARKKTQFIVLRHDIEFSIAKALQMARIEANSGAKAAYFVQFSNRTYNPFARENCEMMREIALLGHSIGLHYRQEEDCAEVEIMRQMDLLSRAYGVPIEIFSTHRPRADSHYEKYEVAGAINAYGATFFTRTENPNVVQTKYISDSKYRWNYGYPSQAELEAHGRIQILVHPFQWFENQTNMADCFEALTREKNESLRNAYAAEYKRYKEISNAGQELEVQTEYNKY